MTELYDDDLINYKNRLEIIRTTLIIEIASALSVIESHNLFHTFGWNYLTFGLRKQLFTKLKYKNAE